MAQIIVIVKDGSVQDVVKQGCDDVSVLVRDYDVQSIDVETKDEDGFPCVENEY